nr:immunoglobulin light chain junction region [Macaca mulatta]MOW02224.1 immunoglobulin light chain junction region [Macaca mulatta]MOW02916.1 immunoglobulin light chain junction region [Macaca mulatta]MOW03444.1 immunoglobulin light chain junction region [Macaca mulatta]
DYYCGSYRTGSTFVF